MISILILFCHPSRYVVKESAEKIPDGLHCFTINVNDYVHSSGFFKLEVKFTDWTHDIDHSTILFTHSYTICYKSLPLTLKFILNNGQISGNGGNAVMMDIDGVDIKGVKCALASSECAIGHSNADATDEAYKICSIDCNIRFNLYGRPFRGP